MGCIFDYDSTREAKPKLPAVHVHAEYCCSHGDFWILANGNPVLVLAVVAVKARAAL